MIQCAVWTYYVASEQIFVWLPHWPRRAGFHFHVNGDQPIDKTAFSGGTEAKRILECPLNANHRLLCDQVLCISELLLRGKTRWLFLGSAIRTVRHCLSASNASSVPYLKIARGTIIVRAFASGAAVLVLW